MVSLSYVNLMLISRASIKCHQEEKCSPISHVVLPLKHIRVSPEHLLLCLDIRLCAVHELLQLQQLNGKIDIVLQVVLSI